ncbi:MAG: hypothetical protein M3443_20915 [Actinomycetota bacterium]|nr:hypothetical protein [Actinomycetota bacterium]
MADRATTDRERLWATYQQVEKWREITSTPQRVDPHSSIGADDRLFSVVPVSHLIWHGISHAVDHLDMYLHALVETKMSFPIAPQSLARSGLLGAAHALWMLDEPNRAQRQLRALRIAHEEWRNERNAYQDLIDWGEGTPGMKTLIDVRTDWMACAIEAGESIGWTAVEVKTKPIDTVLIEDVITRYESSDLGQPRDISLRAAYLLMWRMLSGSTHGYRWAAIPRTRFRDADARHSGSGDVDGYLTNSEEQHAMSAGALALLIKRAIELYDLRRAPHIT